MPSAETDAEDFHREDLSRDLRGIPIPITAPFAWEIISSREWGHEAILHLQSASDSTVTALITSRDYDLISDDFRQIFIYETPAFLLTEETHSQLFLDFLGYQMILSTEGDFVELLELAEFWVYTGTNSN